MKKLSLALFLAALAAAAFAETPVVSDIALTQNPDTLAVTVTYALTGAPAIVTVDFTTNGVSIGAANERTVGGDVNTYVETGAVKRIFWSCDSDWPSQRIADGSLKAVVTAWALDNPPDYMVCDLCTTNAVSFYVSEDALPFAVTNDLYKKTHLVMRRVHAANREWCMGSPAAGCEMGCTANERDNVSVAHQVVLTRDYYIGVYPVTQWQYYYMTGGYSGGSWPSTFKTSNNYVSEDQIRLRPVESVSCKNLRGTTEVDGSGYDWPQDGHTVAPNSAIGKLRALTGVASFDLPTEAQWEFACRAWTCTGLNSGKDVTTASGSGVACANLAEVGWYGGNVNVNDYGNSHRTTRPVGLLKPNQFGLYDMHGNVQELCLDRYSSGETYKASFAAGWQDGVPTFDPVGSMTGTNTVYRGGDYFYGPYYARSAYRFSLATVGREYKSEHYGFRVVCKVDFK